MAQEQLSHNMVAAHSASIAQRLQDDGAARAKHKEYKVAEVLHVDRIRKQGAKKGAGKMLVELHDGERNLTVVTQYSNVEVGHRVILAPEGSIVQGNQVRRKKEAGEWNEGTICGPLELGWTDHGTFCSCITLNDSHIVGDFAPTSPSSLSVDIAHVDVPSVYLSRRSANDREGTNATDCSNSSLPLASQRQTQANKTIAEDQVSLVQISPSTVQGNTFIGEWDEEGVYFYQAYNKQIADWAVQHQRFGGPGFDPKRMTWIKPSFAWVLYRAGYGHKDRNQACILKVKLSHGAVAEILARCRHGHGNGGGEGRVQWDPARTLLRASAKEPARSGGRAIQIGMCRDLSCFYVSSTLSIADVTSLAQDVYSAHALKPDDCLATVQDLLGRGRLPNERPYMPLCRADTLSRLCLRGTLE